MGWPPKHGPLKSGYQRFFGIYPGAADYFSHSGDGEAVPEDTSLIDGETPVERAGYLTDLLAERARAEIADAAAARQPFFVSLHFTAPHWPWQGPGDAATARRWRNLFHLNAGTLEKYAELVTAMDGAIGRVLAEVDRLGLREDTIVIFTSDNGGERFSDNWPLRGEKTDLLEGGIRVPLVVRWPRRIPAGRTTDQVMVSMDWLPTLSAAAGAAPETGTPLDGENLMDVLRGRTPARERRIFWRYKNGDQAAVRSGSLKYLRRRGAESLYDVAADPRERANLKDDAPAAFEELKRAHLAWNETMLPYPAGSISAGSD
jgi:arylsulfatase A-like enzyme